MIRPIAISLSPNTQTDDVWLAFKTLINPLSYMGKKEIQNLENDFEIMFGKEFKAISVDSGRSALYLILQSMDIHQKDEILTQAFSCIAVANSIIWVGAKPIYLDIDKNYNIDPKDLEKKINKNTKALIIQNTFGVVSDYDEIFRIVRLFEKKFKHKIYVIEDCAHSLGASYKRNKVGTLGDAAFFSFGRDKIISSVFGGMIISKNIELSNKILQIQRKLATPNLLWQMCQIVHPIIFNTLILPFYFLGIGKITFGKILLFVLQKIGVLSMPVTVLEKVGKKPMYFLQKMPNSLAILARQQLGKLNEFNEHRKKIAQKYYEKLSGLEFDLPPKPDSGSIWLRFPIRHKNAMELLIYAKERQVLLGSWYKGIIQPALNLDLVFYKKGSCPVSEEYSMDIINLPTYPTFSENDFTKVVNVLKSWKNTKL